MLVGGWLNVTLMQQTFSMANVTTVAPALAVMLVAIFVRNTWAQRLAVVGVLTLQAVYFAQYLPSIGG